MKKIDEKINRVPASFKGHFRRAYSGTSRKSAIVAKCLDCCLFVRKEITECTVKGCPLYAYRPYQADETHLEENIFG